MNEKERKENEDKSKRWAQIRAHFGCAHKQAEELYDGGDIALIADGLEQICEDRANLYKAMSIERKPKEGARR